MDHLHQKTKAKAVLVGVQLPDTANAEHEASLDELARLAKTLGFEVIARVSQKRKAPAPGTVLGEGKVNELAQWTGGPGLASLAANADDDLDSLHAEAEGQDLGLKEKANLVIFDCEITPNQLMLLEKATGVEVLDRTGVILEIFHKHARSSEARLQVELAKLGYLAPRLRASRVGQDRQGGGIGAKGAGETAHELDRRRIRDRMAELRQQLQGIGRENANRRSQRVGIPTVALVGYTNAGKSSLMRALTGSQVLVEDKLFATLDTTVRSLYPETSPRILVSDTVGFIKKLPHGLVASFRSTLDEALSASLLLYTVDASDPTFRSQLKVTQDVLAEIDAGSIRSLLVFNKIDRLSQEELESLRAEFPQAVFISTINPEDIKKIREMILTVFEEGMTEQSFLIPFTRGDLIGQIRKTARVLSEIHHEQGTELLLRAKPHIHQWLAKLLQENG